MLQCKVSVLSGGSELPEIPSEFLGEELRELKNERLPLSFFPSFLRPLS